MATPHPEPEVNKLFRMVIKHKGSALHLKAGMPPMIRLKGVIRQMEMKLLSNDDIGHLLSPILNDHNRKLLEDTGSADFDHVIVTDECRFRVSVFKEHHQFSLVALPVNQTGGDL